MSIHIGNGGMSFHGGNVPQRPTPVDPLQVAANRAFLVFQEWDNKDPMPFNALDADGQFAWERIAAAAVSGYMETVSKGMKVQRMREDE